MENFSKEVKVPVLLPTNAKKVLYISCFLGNRGLEVYNELFDNSSKTKNLESNIKIWKSTKIDVHLNDELKHYHSKVSVSPEEWSELIKLIPNTSNVKVDFESEKNYERNHASFEKFRNKKCCQSFQYLSFVVSTKF